MPVRYVIRPQTEELHDYRGYAGKIISGLYRVGDEIRGIAFRAQQQTQPNWEKPAECG
jgi:sulfate adenylyltransferase subunit 1 (EFTu-like GTPase family)